MRYVKKILALLAALAMLASLCACGASTEVVPVAEAETGAEAAAPEAEDGAQEAEAGAQETGEAESAALSEAEEAAAAAAEAAAEADPNQIALTIGDVSYTVAQMNYYYASSFMAFYNNNYTYIAYGMAFDPGVSLAAQEYSEGVTWRDFFLDYTVSSMEEIQFLCETAEAEGFVMPEEYEAGYASAVESTWSSWEEYGYESPEAFLLDNYGSGVTKEIVEQELYRTYYAAAYSDYVWASYDVTDTDITAYYDEHQNEYDEVTFSYCPVTQDEEGNPLVDADVAAAELRGATPEEFEAYFAGIEGLSAYSGTMTAGNLPVELAEWLYDPARVAGDTAAIFSEDYGDTFIVLFTECALNDYYPVAFRHILITADDADESGDFSEEEIAAAQARVQEIYDEWLAGSADEESFAELANLYTDDTGSATNGGLYENVIPGQMVEVVDSWIFDPARQLGDTTIVVNDGSYTGAHLLYFAGASDQTYTHQLIEQTIRNSSYTEWVTQASTSYAVNMTDAIDYCGYLF